MTITPERQKKYDFSMPYIDAGQILIVPKAEKGVKLADLKGKVDGVYVAETVLLTQMQKEVVEVANANGLPVFSQLPGISDAGALVTLEAEPVEQGQLLAVHTIQVLNGQKAFTLPVRTPKKVDLIINMKVADGLGIKIPFQALGMATRVIK